MSSGSDAFEQREEDSPIAGRVNVGRSRLEELVKAVRDLPRYFGEDLKKLILVIVIKVFN